MPSGRSPNRLENKAHKSPALAFYFALRGYVLAALLVLLIFARIHGNAPLQSVFLLLVAAGMVLRLWAGACLGIHGNAARTEAPQLTRNGPYRFSRNPLYLSNLLVAAGLLLFANCLQIWLVLLTLILLFAHHALLVKWEEQNLRAQWGETYASYLRTTSRWLGWPHSSGPKTETGKSQVHWNKVGAWQGRNLIYAMLSVLLIWGATRWK